MNYFQTYKVHISVDFLIAFSNNYHALEALCWDSGISIEEIRKQKPEYFCLFDELISMAQFSLKEYKEDILLYFGKSEKEKKTEELYSFVLLHTLPELYEYETIEALQADITSYSKEEFNEHFGSVLSDYSNSLVKNSVNLFEIHSISDVALPVLKMDIADEYKSYIQQFYISHDMHLKKMLTIMEKAIELLSHYEERINALVEEFYEYWKKIQGKRTFYEFITQDFYFFSSLPEYQGEYQLLPVLFIPRISLTIPDEGDRPANLCIGYIFGETIPLQMIHQSTPTQILEAINLLSEPTRMQIMDYISKSPTYGSDIADHLKLSNATVSHHMNQLYSAGLVDFKQENTKFIYSINRTNLKRYINYFASKLL